DYYDFVSHSGGSVDIVIGDISGKGISAALLMASIQSLLRSHLEDWQGVQPGREASILCRLNRQLYRHSAPNRFSTLVLGHLNAENLTFRYCNAGHNPPLVFSGRSVRKLETGGTVIGLFEGLKYQEELVQTRPGDLILLYTDGVIEATSLSGEEFGEERLVRLISENRFLTAEDIRKTVIEEVQRHSGREVPEDDITLVCLKILEDHSSGKRKP
ncbi:MAG TPA: PP2C family protein-serine/threonine phosphatase, partial [Acidobacteriota bacterium]|nr:PP2C family protein-serine/threonine phosphatase [Acidobacteriota bacterium]